MPTPEADDLIALTRQIIDKELRPRVDEAERHGTFPRDVFRTLGEAGLLGLPYPEEYGGGQPFEVYLQGLEEIASAWASVGVGASVHALSCFALTQFGTKEQMERHLPAMLGGALLGGYCLSEAHAGSDPAAMRTRAVRADDDYVIEGAKAWTTHGGEADFYTVLARTSDDRGRGISCFLVPASTPGLTAGTPETKMGLTGSITATMFFDGVRVPVANRIGTEGRGLSIALAALDAGRLGIAAVATGLAQASLDVAIQYARQRQTFGRPIISHQGVAFLLADMVAAVETARATYLNAARLKDAGKPYSRQASVAKLVATDNAMKVTTESKFLAATATPPTFQPNGSCVRRRCCRLSRAPTKSSVSSLVEDFRDDANQENAFLRVESRSERGCRLQVYPASCSATGLPGAGRRGHERHGVTYVPSDVTSTGLGVQRVAGHLTRCA